MRRLTAFVLLTFFAVAPAHAGEYTKLTNAELHDVLSGHTIVGEARDSVEAPVIYMFSEEHASDGTVLFKAPSFGFEQKGSWYLLGDNKVCYKYRSSKDYPGATCIWVYSNHECYYTYGLEEMTVSGPKDYDDWSGRWVIEGSGKSCAAPVS